ncbi:unnamed protein product [Musa textilis]
MSANTSGRRWRSRGCRRRWSARAPGTTASGTVARMAGCPRDPGRERRTATGTTATIGIAPIAARRIAGAVAGTGRIATRVGITAATKGTTEIGRGNGAVVAGREDTMGELTGNWREQGAERGRGNENLRGRSEKGKAGDLKKEESRWNLKLI